MRLKQILHIYDSTPHRQENQDHGLYTERHPGHKRHQRTEKVNQLALLSRTYQMLYLLQPLSKKSIPTAPHSFIEALNPSTV